MRTRPRDATSPIWAITCYFNTSDSPRRLHNFLRFRERLGIPLVAIELSFDGEFDLDESDAEILLRRTSRDVLWHKERLLNLALDAVPEHCAAIAWIDADVLFENESWHEEALVALETTPFLQPYDRYHDLPEAGDRLEDAFASGSSFAAEAVKSPDGEVLRKVGARGQGGSHNAGLEVTTCSGLVWVARADLIRRHRLYDGFILGSGDRAMALAALGRFGDTRGAYLLNEARFAHYEQWARPFHRAVGGCIGYVPGDVLHLWHGDLADRRYRQRAQAFAKFDFDPDADIAVDDQGCWQWSSDKPEMHRYFAEYFRARGM